MVGVIMERNLGKMGETQFVYLCNTVDITCTKPEEDKYGWDYYLEFPNEYVKTISKDKQKSPIECKVQIKSTDKNDFKLSVKLSAMFRLVQANMPAFISFLHFNKTNNIQEMYLVHIDENIICDVLKRVRKTELTKKPLNKSSITINYSEEHKVNDISGNGLKNTIKKYIPLGMNEYVIKKNKSLKELGYEGHAFNFNVKFKSTVGDILDMSLGLKDSVDVELGQFLEKRFNILLPIEHPLSNIKSAQLSINPEPIKDIQVVIKQTPISIPLVTYQMKLYNSAFNQFLKGNNYKFLLKNDFLSFCLTNDGMAQKINFHFNYEDHYNLQELSNALKLPYLFKENKDKPLTLEIREENKKMFHFKMKLNIDGNFDWMIKAYEYSSYLLKTYSLLEINNNISLSLDELKYHTGYIECLYYFLTGKPEEIKLELNLLDDNIFEDNIKDFICVIPVGVLFSDKLTGVVFIFHCDKVDLIEKVLTLRGSKINIYEKFEISVDDFNKEEFSNYLDEIVSKYENDDVLCFNINKWIPKLNINEGMNRI
jgi:hypothetical protein